MAKMYPTPIDPETKSPAERVLYAAFRDQLDDSYLVFHSVAWQDQDERGRPQDGEADFVVVHPDRGILVIEAKGGTIRRDGQTGQWTSTDGQGAVHEIKNPFDQGLSSQKILLNKLKRIPSLTYRFINTGHAVAFPGTIVPDEDMGPEMPQEIILDLHDLSNVAAWVERVLTRYRGGRPVKETAPGPDAVAELRKLLARPLELRPALWGQFLEEQSALLQLTREQYTILDALNRHRRAAISGPAGSGKTMLAVEKATRLAEGGFHVLLTCFNKALAADLTARLKPKDNLDIQHFHGLCTTLAQKAGIRVGPARGQAYFDDQLPEALMEAADKLDLRYDAIIVDEGQDFQDTLWIPLQMLLRDAKESILYVFYDDNQRLYSADRDLPVPTPPFALTANCRNTQAIHRVLLKFYRGEDPPTVQGPPGRPVKIIEFAGNDTLSTTLAELLDDLTAKEGIPTDEIVVLTPFAADRSELWADPPAGRIRLTENWPPAKGRVYCTTIHSFKGLERGVIILTELERRPATGSDRESLLYVGCSRASNQLIVVLPKAAPSEVRQLFS